MNIPHRSPRMIFACTVAGRIGFCLAVNDLSVTLGGRRVLDKLCLDVSGGQVVALVGANGSGKTTLLRSLVGLQRYEGTVSVTDGARPTLGWSTRTPTCNCSTRRCAKRSCTGSLRPTEIFTAG